MTTLLPVGMRFTRRIDMIVASAIKKDGVVYTGRRHNNILCDRSRPFGFLRAGEQGFVTDTGEFLDRVAAAVHAFECGQLSERKVIEGGRLYSEDLW
jgi:hypothetical protein